jgi:urease accessory protein
VSEQCTNHDLRRWPGRLSLEIAPGPGGGLLGRTEKSGPLSISRPFYPARDTLELYVLHPPGGLVQGDSLNIEINVKKKARALLTTPSAQKLYKAGAEQRQNVILNSQGDLLEWLPQETIIFDGADGYLALSADIGPMSRCIGWDILALGAGKGLTGGRLVQEIRLKRSGRLLWRERWSISPPDGSRWLRSRFGLDGQTVMGILWALGREDESNPLPPLGEKIMTQVLPRIRGGVTVRTGLLLVRLLSCSTELTRHCLENVWGLIRQNWGGEIYRPRIWST